MIIEPDELERRLAARQRIPSAAKGRAAAVLIPLSEYLGHTYDPDREYLEGMLQERNVGEINHGEAQSALIVFIRTQLRGFWAVVEVRVQVKPNRFRIPDVSIHP